MFLTVIGLMAAAYMAIGVVCGFCVVVSNRATFRGPDGLQWKDILFHLVVILAVWPLLLVARDMPDHEGVDHG